MVLFIFVRTQQCPGVPSLPHVAHVPLPSFLTREGPLKLDRNLFRNQEGSVLGVGASHTRLSFWLLCDLWPQ